MKRYWGVMSFYKTLFLCITIVIGVCQTLEVQADGSGAASVHPMKVVVDAVKDPPKKSAAIKKDPKIEQQEFADLSFKLSKEAYDEGKNELGLKFLRQAAEAGHVEAQFYMGMKYFNGGQLPKDDQLSIEWLEKAAKKGHVAAAFQMATKYMRGVGVKKDEKKAHRYLDQSVTNGNTDLSAKFLLGQNYLYGFGTKKQPLVAVNWLRQAAAEGHENSIKMLASPEVQKILKESVFQSCEICPQMVILPSGAFLMGVHDPGNPNTNVNPKLQNVPRHFVNLPHTLAIGQTEITYGQWAECVKDKACHHDQKNSPVLNNDPLVNVSWKDAKEYVAWLSYKTGKEYRLPTESEWEYAARSGMNTAYPFGEKLPNNKANCSGCGSKWDNKTAATVKSFKANGYGMYEMLGNVSELTEDCANESYLKKPPMGIAWITGLCGARIVRGGAWDTGSETLRVYDRDYAELDEHRMNMGFRVALTLKEPDNRLAASKAETDKRDKIEAYKKKPYCGGDEDLHGWHLFWKYNYYSLKPELYDVEKSYDATNLLIIKNVDNTYQLNFNYKWACCIGVNVHELYVDGVKVYEGKWKVETSKDGKTWRKTPPVMGADIIKKMEEGRVAEIRVIHKGVKSLNIPDKIAASSKFSLEHFSVINKRIKENSKRTAEDKQAGRCREQRGFLF